MVKLKLLSEQQMEGVRRVAEMAMTTPVTIMRKTGAVGLELSEDPYGSSVAFSDVTPQKGCLGWLHSTPTPVAIMNQSPESALVTFISGTTSIIADYSPPGQQLYTFEYCNIQYIIDQTLAGTGPCYNTTTLTINWSMDNSTWSDGPAIVAANVADAESVVQVPQLGRYMRIYADVTNANPITITAKGVCK